MPRTKQLIKLTASNYLATIIKFVVMVYLTREMFLLLPKESYGFWALLWSIFGYSVLLDLGFGIALQKKTSEVLVHQDWKSYNRTASTLFGTYFLLGFVIVLLTCLSAPFLHVIFVFEPGQGLIYTQCFLLFGIGTGLLFPFGIFMEVLRGALCIQIRNRIEVLRDIANCIALVIALRMHADIRVLAVIAVTSQCLANIAMYIATKRALPRLRLSWRLYSPTKMVELMSFSLCAYVITISNLIVFRTDQIVISALAGVGLVAYYHVTTRVAEIFRLLCSQIHDLLAPMSSSFNAQQDQQALRQLLLRSQRFVCLIVVLLIVPSWFFIEDLLRIWLEIDNQQTFWCARILLLNIAILVIYRNTTNQILLMCGYQKPLMWIGITECIANLILSCLLIHPLGILGVALGTLIPNILLAIFVNIPMTRKFTNTSHWQSYKPLIIVGLTVGLPYAAGLVLFEQVTASYNSLLHIIAVSVICAIPALFSAYKCCLSAGERHQLKRIISSMLPSWQLKL
ncbi:lipopolysaccharide biosynthesis protein [Shewanella sp.]|uniref:lipopolysaccharide biosynthesis protein n=1 Tax=Shewanella sp. TaxID=50422 RepID=UPI001EB73A70|nr:polysaccharide biosynthesis C-terminal domain-containing protein [Shewanella sp.]NRB22169.1 oligosaccharide flippase family protein [Shewanella sp.]